MLFDIAILLIFPAAMAYACATDLLTMTIPNRVSIVLVAGFAVLAPFAGLSIVEIGWHVAVGMTALTVAFGMFAMGWIGGGDAKLFSATALWLGPSHMLEYGFVAALLGGAVTLAIIVLRKFPLHEALARQEWLARLHNNANGVPYGIALAAAGLLVYPHTVWMAALGT